jgi:hypothetical protein
MNSFLLEWMRHPSITHVMPILAEPETKKLYCTAARVEWLRMNICNKQECMPFRVTSSLKSLTAKYKWGVHKLPLINPGDSPPPPYIIFITRWLPWVPLEEGNGRKGEQNVLHFSHMQGIAFLSAFSNREGYGYRRSQSLHSWSVVWCCMVRLPVSGGAGQCIVFDENNQIFVK